MPVFRAFAAVLVASAALVLAGPLWAGDAQVQALQQQVDDLEGKIRQVVRELSNASDPQAIQELNRQKRLYESRRSAAVFALYQAREAGDLEREKKARLQADVAAFKGAAADFISELGRYAADLRSLGSDADAQQAAVRTFNGLPPGPQRSRAEAERLNQWGARVRARAASLQAWRARLQTRRSELQGWLDRVNARGAGLR